MSYEFIKYEVSDNGVANVLLNRPEKLNALSLPLQRELYDCLQEADDDLNVRVITLRGAGRAFCAGYAGSFHGHPSYTYVDIHGGSTEGEVVYAHR